MGFSFLVKSTGVVMGCGKNSNGQVGVGNTTNPIAAPTTVTGLTNIIKAVGCNSGNHSLFLHADGSVYSCGNNSDGQLGHGNTTQLTSPSKISSLSNVIDISVGNSSSFFLLKDKTVKSCGNNSNNQIGHSSTSDVTTPTAISGLSNVIQVVAADNWGQNATIFVIADGTLKGIGNTSYGQFGDGASSRDYNSITTLSGISNVKMVSMGTEHTLVLLNTGAVKAAGNNDYGQLGQGNTTALYSFTSISGLSTVTHLQAGGNMSFFLKTDGYLYFCGSNGNGAAGTSNTTSTNSSVALAGHASLGRYNNTISYFINANNTVLIYIDKDGNVKWSGSSADKEHFDGNNGTSQHTPNACTGTDSAQLNNPWTFEIHRLQGNGVYKHLQLSTALSASSFPDEFLFLSNTTSGTYAVNFKTVQTMTNDGTFYGYSNVSGSAGGDPYIYPLFGTNFKLPNIEKPLRLLDNCDIENRFFMNGTTYIVSKEEADNIETEIKDKCHPDNYKGLENIGLEGGCFFDEIYLENNNNDNIEYLSFNLKEFSYQTNIHDFENKLSYIETKEDKIKIYMNEKKRLISFRLENEYNKYIDIIISAYVNPQIRSSIQFMMGQNEEKSNGLFSFYKNIEHFYLDDINDKKNFNYQYNKKCSEIYESQQEEFKIGGNEKFIELV
jgi:alpha-tubulin suppressor-like RCC1 family protein